MKISRFLKECEVFYVLTERLRTNGFVSEYYGLIIKEIMRKACSNLTRYYFTANDIYFVWFQVKIVGIRFYE